MSSQSLIDDTRPSASARFCFRRDTEDAVADELVWTTVPFLDTFGL